MTRPPAGLWFGVGLEPTTETFTVLAVAKTEAECRANVGGRRAESGDPTYVGVFDLAARDGAARLHTWLRECGVPDAEARKIMKAVADQIRATERRSRRGRKK